ncbi:MAG: DUF4962 domain-containing protein [Armatimonadota bacterium]|nr:DUF4962 domain-containing protein [Armatimonadota bacterium]
MPNFILTPALLLWGMGLSATSNSAPLPPRDSPYRLVFPSEGSAADLQRLTVRVQPDRMRRHPWVLFSREEVKAGLHLFPLGGKDPARRAAELAAWLRQNPPTPTGTGYLTLLEAASLFWSTEDPDLARASIDWMLHTTKFPKWTHGGWRDNYDLAAAYLLTAVGIGYDSLYDCMTDAERRLIRDKLVLQGRVVAEQSRITPRSRRQFDYDQNHYYVPVAALGLVAFALYNEVPEAREWADLCRRFMDRTLAFYTVDGYFFEGLQYWNWTFGFILRYLYALERLTGETLVCEGFRELKYALAHLSLPGKNRFAAFFFADTGEKEVTLGGRVTHYHDRPLYLNFGQLAFLAPRLNDPLALGVVQHYRPGQTLGHPAPPPPDFPVEPITKMPPYHYFRDNEVVAWRSGWGDDVLCVAFKCGPHEGHAFRRRFERFVDAYFNCGHSHPDANSFQIDAGGELLACGPGYVRNKMAAWENTLLVDGRGQRNEGQVHVWRALGDQPEVPYAVYDQLRMEKVHLASLGGYACGESAPVCYPELRMRRVRRHLLVTAGWGDTLGHVLLFDELESELPHVYTFLTHTVREMESIGPRRWLARGRRMGLRIVALGEGPLTGAVRPTLVDPYGRPTMPLPEHPGLDRRAVHVAITNDVPSRRWQFLTSLLPWPLAHLEHAPAVEPLVGDGVWGARLQHGGVVETVLVAPNEAWRVGSFQGASSAAAWVDEGGRRMRLLLLGARRARVADVVLDSDTSVEVGLARGVGGSWEGEILVARPGRVRLEADGRALSLAGGTPPRTGWVRLDAGRHPVGP